MKQWRDWLCLLALIVGMAPAGIAYAAPAAQGDVPASAFTADLAGCEELEPVALRDELNRISQQIFAEGEAGLDLDALVQREWTALRVDAAIDRAVADAVSQVRARSDGLERFLSGWSPTQAEALTQEIAMLAFTSDVFQDAIDRLSEAVAVAVAAEFGRLSAQSAVETTFCLQAYIGAAYSQSFVTAFAEEIRAGAAQADLDMEGRLDSGLLTLLGQHRAALGGVGVIVATQIAGRMVQRIGQDLARRVAGRIAGRVLGRIGAAAIPAVGWVVGLGLIIYDLAEGRDGALPQIQAGLQGADVKAIIRAEIVDAVDAELRPAVPDIARAVANDLYAEWLDFQRKYQQVLALANENPQFRAFLSDVSDIGHLATLVDVLLATVGRSGLDGALAGGELQRLLTLPLAAVEILRVTGSVAAPLAWANLAGGQLDQVVSLEIFRHTTPEELDRATLTSLIALNDRGAIAKLTLLEPDARQALLRLASPTLLDVTARLSAAELAWLARYLAALSQAQANQLTLQVLQSPVLMERLQHEALIPALARSENLAGALAFLAAPAEMGNFPGDTWSVMSGQVSGRLFVAKYGWPVTLGAGGFGLLALAAVVYSLILWLLGPVLAVVRFFRGPARRRGSRDSL